MATEWKSQQSAGDYRLQFQADDKEKYKLVEKAAQMAVDGKHTADVVEVVRCKDCKYLYCLSAVDRRFYCRHFPQGLKGINIVEDNPFCSYGERREE